MTQLANFLIKAFIALVLILSIANISFAQTSKDTLILKDQINKLQTDLEDQKTITSTLLEKINNLIDSQNSLIKQYTQTNLIIQNLQTGSTSSNDKFKDAFIVNKEGKPYAFIDKDLKLYEYYGQDLLGWINPDTSELVRNFDEAVVAIIDGDFILDETGHAIASIERSENLKWDREKLYSQVQKRPLSNYFIKLENPQQFNKSTFKFSDWSLKKIEDILFFSEKRIQKLK